MGEVLGTDIRYRISDIRTRRVELEAKGVEGGTLKLT